MISLLGIVFAMFAIIAVGKFAVWRGFFSGAESGVITRFTFYVPMPALLFGLVAEGSLANVSTVAWTFLVVNLLMYGAALGLGRWLASPTLAHRAVFALDVTWGNHVFMGTPLIGTLYGASGLSILVGIIIATTGLLPLSAVLMEIGIHQGGRTSTARSTLLGILKNPVNLAMALGLVWRLAGIPLPGPAHQFLDLLGRAAAPLALFCLGATLPPVSRGVITEAMWATIIKLFVLPVVMVAVCYALNISGLPMAVAVISAALPTGANAFLLARGTTEHGAASATTMVLATAFAMLTLPAILYLLSE